MREMKDSGVEWIGEIPKNWKVERLRYIIKDYKSGPFGSALKMDGLLPDGNILIYSPEHITLHSSDSDKNLYLPDEMEEEMSQFIVKENDILFPIVGSLGKAMIITADMPKGIINQRVAKFQIDNTIVDQDYFMWLFAKSNFYKPYIDLSCRGSFIVNLTKAIINDMPCVIQPLAIQKKISTYLDVKCSKIDEVIEKQQAIIEKLKEYKLSVIIETVTKGLNPNVEMKDSGVEWIGQMPTSWDCTTVGRIATVVRGASPRPAGDPLYFNGNDVPWITVAEVTKGDGKYIDGTETFLTFEGAKQSRIVEEGTLLLSNSGATLGVPKITRIRGCINDGSVAFYNLSINQEFLLYLFKGRTFELRKQMQGYGQPNLNTTIVKGIEVTLPTELEQKLIVDFLDQKCTAIEKTIEDREKAIDKLQEYKKSLIYEVVTGKKEV